MDMTDVGETITLGGGCFWCLEAVFEQINGVNWVKSGYAGGHTDHPTYQEVCSGTTGHAEVVQVNFDRDMVSLEDILEIFFDIHDPTTLNRQGYDVGTQYRSAIFYHNDKQKEYIDRLFSDEIFLGKWDNSVTTEVRSAGIVYSAEDYHQEYYRRNFDLPYCQVVITPKMLKLKDKYSHKMKPALTLFS